MATKALGLLAKMVIIAGIFMACQPSMQSLCGTYRMTHSEGTEILILSSDMSYTQTYNSIGKIQINTGQWRMEREHGFTRIYMKDWQLFSDPYRTDNGTNHEGERFTTSYVFDSGEIAVYPDLSDYIYRKALPVGR